MPTPRSSPYPPPTERQARLYTVAKLTLGVILFCIAAGLFFSYRCGVNNPHDDGFCGLPIFFGFVAAGIAGGITLTCGLIWARRVPHS